MKNMSNIRQILFVLTIVLATALIAVFIYELLWCLDTANFSNVTNSVANNNQIAAREVQNVSTNLTNNVTLPSATDNLNNPGTLAVTDIFSTLGVIIILSAGYAIAVFTGYAPHPLAVPAHAQAIIDAGSASVLNQ
uniref:hypothetical protein n=1 Tax=Porodaedalea chrysoloma TaxID=74615 RepID=UPI0023AA51C3|nr:hypothetical protein P1S03_mgp29 [Porodaedalea chrysoloma]WCF76777.1 hypothetical protein [Porodaedalea chrysoloma]